MVEEVDHEFLPFLRVYKNGRIEKLLGTEFVPPSLDPHIPVSSKDITINADTGLSARLYVPKTTSKDKKLPLLIYFHGGGFLIESALSPIYHNYLNSLVQEANVVAVSVEYRLAPEHPVPTAYDDSWEAIQWVFEGGEAWLRDYADFDKVFLGGDSAGANIAHHMAMRDLKFLGVVLVQPYFWGEERIGSEGSDLERKAMIEKIWRYACPSTVSYDDPLFNPVATGAPSLCKLACRRVLVLVAEKDLLKDRGLLYYESLKRSGWGGVAEAIETEGEDHVFHLFNPTCDKAITMMKSLASFLNRQNTPR